MFFMLSEFLSTIEKNVSPLFFEKTTKITVKPLITVTSAQRPPPDLRSVKKVPAKFKVKLS